MRLVGFGATGGTGGLLVEQALGAGHKLTVVARHPGAVTIHHVALEVAGGDVLEPASLQGPVAGADAVVSTIGVRGRGPTTLYSQGTASIIAAMRAGGVHRLVVVSAAPIAGSDEADDTLPYRLLVKPALRALLKRSCADMARMEEVVRRSGLDWTILRPPGLTDKPRTGRYRVALRHTVRRGYFLSRADLADAALRFLEDPDAVKATIGLGN